MRPYLPPLFTKKVQLCRYNPINRFHLLPLVVTLYDMSIVPFEESAVYVNPRPYNVEHIETLAYHQYFKGTTNQLISTPAFDNDGCGIEMGPCVGDIFIVTDGIPYTEQEAIQPDPDNGVVGTQYSDQYAVVNIRKYPTFQVFVLGLIGSEVNGDSD